VLKRFDKMFFTTAIFALVSLVPRALYYVVSCCVVYRFKTSRNNHLIQVELDDEIDFVCPFYSSTDSASNSDQSHFEYYIIYQVINS
jgi:Ephrin